MKTTIPKNRGSDYGLVYTQNVWRAHFSRSGKRYYRSLRTQDIAVARERRDALYAALRAAGADHPKRLRAEVNPDDDSGIYRTKPAYAVKIHGKHIGTAPTLEKARAMKRKHLLTQSDNLTP